MEFTTINSEQVKVEPMDAENDGTLIQEINVEDDDGNGNFLSINLSKDDFRHLFEQHY